MHSPLPENCRGHILAIDDTPNNLRLLANMFTVLGYKIRSVSEPQMALMVARACPPDLILLDVNMPEMNGFDVCRALKTHPRTSDIPVIFISAHDAVVEKVKAFAVGGVDYITKPFQIEEVLARVENQLVLQKLKHELMTQNQRLQQEIRDREIVQAELQQEIRERQAVEAALRRANEELRALAMLDGLTLVANRRRFDEFLHQEWLRHARDRQPLSLILCDIDHFKPYNDAYGHLAGDDCLRAIAQQLARSVAIAGSLVARYGGEEFGIILPATDLEGALSVAASVQAAIAAMDIPHARSTAASHITLSMGVAARVPSLSDSPDVLVQAADEALYDAKHMGRNHIAANYGQNSPPMPC